MLKKYRRMTFTDRLVIEKMYNEGNSIRTIAKRINFAPSSVHKEIKRGIYLHRDYRTWRDIPRYSATIADDDAKWKSTSKGPALKIESNHQYALDVAQRIKNGESPDSITGYYKSIGRWTVSTKTLYRYIDSGYITGISNKDLISKSSKKRTYKKPRAARPPAGTSIEYRPLYISDRISMGHWEMDTVVGKSKGQDQILLVLTERKSRYEIIRKLKNRSSSQVDNALSNIVKSYPSGTIKTITVDNGSEFLDYQSLKKHATEIYYCHPYSSYERGSNENANRLIRRFLPKGTSFHDVTQSDCDAIASYMNQMHRKSLNYRTAEECFIEYINSLSL